MIVPVLSVFLLALGVLLLGLLAISIERAKAQQSQAFMENTLKALAAEDEEVAAPVAFAARAEQTVVVVPCAETVQSCIVPLSSTEPVTGQKR